MTEIDWSDPENVDAWREMWAFATTAERRRWLSLGFAPGFVLVYALIETVKDADLIDLADPAFEQRVRRAFTRAQLVLLMRQIALATKNERRAADEAAVAAQELELRRATVTRFTEVLHEVVRGR